MTGSHNETLTDTRLWERPLGVPFADQLIIDRAKDWVVRDIYHDHHSYRPELDRVTVRNHVGILDGEIVGAVTYAMPRRSVSVQDVHQSDIVEVARVCVTADIPNLASCLLAKSQTRFCERWGSAAGVDLLISFVHEDYEGSMFRALRGKGWGEYRKARSKRSGNRDYTGIEDEEKTLWVCRTRDIEENEQTTLTEATT